MKISDYYSESARAFLNSSILFLLPAFLLVFINLAYIGNRQVMLLCLPFAAMSLIYYQIHLNKARLAEEAEPAVILTSNPLLTAKSLLVFYDNHFSPGLLLFSPTGVKNGELRNRKISFQQIISRRREFELCNEEMKPLAVYYVTRGKVDVYNSRGNWIGRLYEDGKGQIQLTKTHGMDFMSVSRSRFFMDVKVETEGSNSARLRRGLMPLEWGMRFPDPNTPVFTINDHSSNEEKLLYYSVLVREFFVER
ncbi:hypothetical protein AM500_10855 [Bacillus sp. FJAT-18017]|uniref:hypothetical protein n=1 Tax=Bacillus sp. FJAT-18017 TaxID=1705566 RepID=UPI0006AE1542|nr:hypothetical protein [Bacillus sp. FJAT-18017]ALC90226.1 hypothetical protein AM500_10855 [Bacillus sp. FJAT-18017]